MDDLIKKQDAIEYFMTNTNWHDEEGYTIDDAEDKRALLTEYFNGVPSADEYEIVKEYCHSRCFTLVDSAYFQYLIDFPIVPSAQQWIPCSERLPKKDGRYWVWCEIFIVPDHVDDPCSYYGSREASYLGGHWYGDSIGEVIAWMPLPEPYKAEKE